MQEALADFSKRCDLQKQQIIQTIAPKIIVHRDNRLEIKINPLFKKPDDDGDETSRRFKDGGRRFVLLENGDLHLENTNHICFNYYISDFIEFQVTPWFRDADFLRQKYLVERLSTQQIADLVGSARSTTVKYLKAFKIPLRAENESRKLRKPNLAYGERWQDGKVTVCKREQETIVMIRNLRTQGMGLQAIADFLNSMKIPTKKKNAKWQPATVWYILSRSS